MASDRIYVDPHIVGDVSQQLAQIAEQLTGIGDQLFPEVRALLNSSMPDGPLAYQIRTEMWEVENTLNQFSWLRSATASEVWDGSTRLARVADMVLTFNGEMARYAVNLMQVELSPKSNMRDIITMIMGQYGTGSPIGITQIGTNTILVTLAGVEWKLNQDNNPFTAILAGLGDTNNPYEQDVNKSISQYIQNHFGNSAHVNVVIAGHSLGGMIGEELANKSTQHAGNYNVIDLITFGSPPIPGNISVPHTQYFDLFDPVPRLSLSNLGTDIALGAYLYSPIAAGQKFVPDVGYNPNFIADHSAYENSQWLSQQPINFSITQVTSPEFFNTSNNIPLPSSAKGIPSVCYQIPSIHMTQVSDRISQFMN